MGKTFEIWASLRRLLQWGRFFKHALRSERGFKRVGGLLQRDSVSSFGYSVSKQAPSGYGTTTKEGNKLNGGLNKPT